LIQGLPIVPPVEVSEASVMALIRRWFPDATLAPSIERIGSGVSTPVYRVVLGDTDAFLRLGEEPGERRDAEVRVHELLGKAGVLVPRILRWEREPPELDRSAVLTSRMPGRPIEELTLGAGELATIFRAAGRDLARINAIPVRGYGWVDFVRGADRHLVAEHPTRAAWVVEYLVATDTVIASCVLDPTVHARLTDAMRAWAAIPEQPWSDLAHGDVDERTHIFVATCTYTGIIDFGEIRGTDPFYDLGQALLNAENQIRRDVFANVVRGYQEVTALPDDWRERVRLQAVAIAVRALAIQFGRPPHDYRRFLTDRLYALL